MSVISLRGAIQNSVPISNFNKGMAGKIFSEVRASGPKIVIKNNSPECVLLSPEQYIAMLDEIEDIRLLKVAEERLSYTAGCYVNQEDVMKKFKISSDELNDTEDVDIE